MSPRALYRSYDVGGVVLSVISSIYASYAALDLARRMRGKNREPLVLELTGRALVIDTGILSISFLGMQVTGDRAFDRERLLLCIELL